MEFWKYAYNANWVTKEQLRLAVKTDTNILGEISETEFKEITGEEF